MLFMGTSNDVINRESERPRERERERDRDREGERGSFHFSYIRMRNYL